MKIAISSKAQPLFLVGSPRSGTTLLQSLLAAHPQIASFPESKFFQHAVPRYEPRRYKFGMVSRRVNYRLKEYFENEIDRPEMLNYFPKLPILLLYTRSFVKALDELTIAAGKSIWLEKTPEHLYCIKEIEGLIKQVKFIHIVRNGIDVIASLYEITQRYPKEWNGAWDIDLCIERWKQAIEVSKQYIEKPNHYIVRYECLIRDPRHIMTKICEFIGIKFCETMIENYFQYSRELCGNNSRFVDPKIKKKPPKSERIFAADQIRYIERAISDVNLSIFV